MKIDRHALKMVKVNEREVQKPVYSSTMKWRRKVGTKSVKEHDLEFHHSTTGAKIFAVERGYGKNYKLKWHPDMLEKHPQLADSWEHSSRRNPADHGYMEAKSKDTLGYTAGSVYQHAARNGFRDSLDVKKIPTDDGVTYVFHDRETGEPIASQYPGMTLKHYSSYMKAHDIDPSIVKNKQHVDGYRLAQYIASNKGLSYAAVGHRTNKSTTQSYNLGKNSTPEATSAAHEDKVRKTYGDKKDFSLVRHSPTAFTASHEPDSEYSSGNLITSVVHGGKLFSHVVSDHNSKYGSEPNMDKF